MVANVVLTLSRADLDNAAMSQEMEEGNQYLQKYFTNVGQYPVHSITSHQVKIPLFRSHKPEEIDKMVELELQHLKTHFADEEQRYVDQMLLENPIVVERRPVTTRSETTSATFTDQTSSNSHDAQRQRAESCRKSRYNNKIKKAKLRFRHKFACNQLTESASVLDYMREVIAHAESQLLARGYNRAAVECMRQNFGVDSCNTAITSINCRLNYKKYIP